MSADNGIYILKTPRVPQRKENMYLNQIGYEYRIAHCQAIENIDYSDLYLPVLFGESQIYDTEDEAVLRAQNLYKQITAAGGYIEYGIRVVEKQCYFPNMTPQTAAKALDCYEGAEPV